MLFSPSTSLSDLLRIGDPRCVSFHTPLAFSFREAARSQDFRANPQPLFPESPIAPTSLALYASQLTYA